MIYNSNELFKKMDESGIDIIVASTKENINYFTGYSPVVKTLNPYHGQTFVVISKKEIDKISIVIPIAEVDQIQDCKSQTLEVKTFGTFYREHFDCELTEAERELKELSNIENSYEDAASALENILNNSSEGQTVTIAIDEDSAGKSIIDKINSINTFNVVPASSLIRSVRRIKTSYEVEMLTQSARINECAIKVVIDNLSEGMTEEEIRILYETEIVRQGAIPSLTMIKIGRFAVGGQQTQKSHIKLKSGDLIWFDSDANYQGFWSDIARVYPYKIVTDKAIRFYSALEASMKKAVETIKPGMKASEVFHIMMSTAKDNGMEHYRRHHVGHGIGHEPYELPILSPTDETVLEEGMVISIETPYYELGFGALHIEDPIYIGRDRNVLLTCNPIPSLKVVN
ncbi:Xaa-Pro peptidase family protein [Marinomonas sp. TI.3.20]|uniref:M24 family metallopeptidase n=1 Tax=Marinomonas sp. TI.3.20 TaxID=3121296 RepID=UPI00311FFCB1